jgi:crotonobetainyl-CoA:carnitine CoA-transferase CaiB-like acyl-CoA transferase
MSGPLAGVRVFDLTMNLMGPLASQMLGDMGADIWKIEPAAGDPLRGVGPSRSPKMGGFFMSVNRNKRSIVLDVKHPAARAVVERMIAQSDVFLATLRPQSLERLGLSYDSVRALNPRIVYCNAIGYGQDGRYAQRPAYDDLIQGASGLASLQGGRNGEPQYVATALVDRTVGLVAAGMIAMALYHRERTGEGQKIEVPMFETMTELVMSDHQYGMFFEPPIGTAGYPRMLDPNRRPYKTKDGYVSVLVYTDAHWKRFFILAGRPEMGDDPRYGTITGRTEHISELYALVAETFAGMTTGEAVRCLDEADIPVAPVHTPAGVLEDPHMRDVGQYAVIEHPTEGAIRPAAIASRWSASPPEVRRLAPRLGEHTTEILAELGFDTAQIDELLATGAAGARLSTTKGR